MVDNKSNEYQIIKVIHMTQLIRYIESESTESR